MKTLGSLCLSLLAAAGICMAAPASAQPRDYGGIGMTAYTDVDFRGAVITFRQDEPDLVRSGFNDRISSIRVDVGEQWEVCTDVGFRGRCTVISGEERDLRRGAWNDTISSVRRVGGGYVPPYGGGRDGYDPRDRGEWGDRSDRRRDWNVMVYDQPNYRGRPVSYYNAAASIGIRAESMRIGRGVWEICDRPNYAGRCVIVENSVPDVRMHNFRGRIASLRPVDPRSRPMPDGGEWSIVLFDRTDFRGGAINLRGPVDFLQPNDRAQSVAIEGGVWELCEDANFRGRCITLERSTPDLGAFGMSDRVSSVRPVGR